MATAGAAARPKDFIFLREAGVQVVARGGGAAGSIFSHAEAYYDVRFAFFSSQALEGALGGCARTGMGSMSLCMHF